MQPLQAFKQTTVFHGNTPVSIIDHQGRFWLTAEDVGRCLGYGQGNERDGITRVYNRHIDEFLSEDSVTVKLTATDGKGYDTRVFSKTGCIKLGFFAGTKLAKEFRTWAARMLAGGSPEAVLLQKYRTAFLQASPLEARLISYHEKGLTLSEIGKLVDLAAGSVARRLKRLTELELVDYQPDPELSARGKRGRAKMLAKRAQQALALED
ncbi:BRO family protein [Neisseria bergeri]|uniref:BRO family protein n=1 Tax=Neisseria bergeri TaxID=1906581 RepID=UPI00272C8431|nr:BRO family protein [Neisseria bergeri]